MCPWFAPVHLHKSAARESGRLRINHGENSVNAGEQVDVTLLCAQNTEVSGLHKGANF